MELACAYSYVYNKEGQGQLYCIVRGVAGIFQRGGGGVTVCQSGGTHQIVMSFSSPVVGCLLKKAHRRGRGLTGIPGPPPGYAPDCIMQCYVSLIYRPMNLLNEEEMEKEIKNTIKGLVDREDITTSSFKKWPNTHWTPYELKPKRRGSGLEGVTTTSMIGIGLIGIAVGVCVGIRIAQRGALHFPKIVV